jgi:hypothetical protein
MDGASKGFRNCIVISYIKLVGLSVRNTECHYQVVIIFVVPKVLQLKLVTSLGRPGLAGLQASDANESLEFGARFVRFWLMQNKSEPTVCELQHVATTADTPVGLQVALKPYRALCVNLMPADNFAH